MICDKCKQRWYESSSSDNENFDSDEKLICKVCELLSKDSDLKVYHCINCFTYRLYYPVRWYLREYLVYKEQIKANNTVVVEEVCASYDTKNDPMSGFEASLYR